MYINKFHGIIFIQKNILERAELFFSAKGKLNMKKNLNLLEQIQQLNPNVTIFICQWKDFNLFITTSKKHLQLPKGYFLTPDNFICSHNKKINTSNNYLVQTTDNLVEVLIKLRNKNPKANLAIFRTKKHPFGVIISDTKLTDLYIEDILDSNSHNFLYVEPQLKKIPFLSKRNKLYFKKQTFLEKNFGVFRLIINYLSI